MVDPLSITCGIISIWDLTQNIISFTRAAKDATEDWKRYSDGLKSVACTQKVLESMLKEFPHICNLTFEDEGKQYKLVEHVNDQLKGVREDASAILDRHNQLQQGTKKWKKRYREIFSWSKDVVGFVLEKEHMSVLIKHVEYAQQHLHLALMLASIETSDKWRNEARGLLNTIKTEMVEHRRVLEKLENGIKLSDAMLKLDITARLAPDSKLHRYDIPSSKGKPVQQRNHRTFSKRLHKGLAKIFPSVGEPSIRHVDREGSVSHNANDDDDDGHDGDNETSDNDESPDQIITNGIAREECAAMSPGKFKYDIIIENGEWIQVPVNSSEYSRAVNPFMNHDVKHNHPTNVSTAIRAIDCINSMSDEEWDEMRYRPIEDLTEFFTSACSTAYPTDAEVMADVSRIEMRFQLHAHVFIPETVDLGLCKDAGSARLAFCVDHATVENDRTVLSVTEPCSTRYGRECKHITLEISGERDLVIALPDMIQITGLTCADTAETLQEDNPGPQSYTLMTSPLCRRRNRCHRCHHTRIEGVNHNQPRCSLPIRLCGSSGQVQQIVEDIDDNTERASSEDETMHGPDPRFPIDISPDDDAYAFNLLRLVMIEETSQLPPEIEWDNFVRFLSLAHKYRQSLGDKPLEQARHWVTIFRPSESFDKDAVPWLWIMWKLQMGPEFKRLSSIIQQQAQSSISYLQNQRKDELHIELPDTILEILDQRRLVALSRVRDMMISEIEMFRQQYSEAVTEEIGFPPWPIIETMCSSFAFGYLKLECERWLVRDDFNGDKEDFFGISFISLGRAIRSMMDLEEWKVSTVPPSDKIPVPLAMLSALVPIVGVGLHNSGLHGRCSSNISRRLSELITEIEREDWGVDLTQI
ncbi:hypothetical protein BGZ63DRAFT_464929, partial [Mariannaea sp. PMI_226]